MLFKAKVLQSIFMALFIGGLFFDIGTTDYTQRTNWQSITGFLFFMTINSMMMTLSPITLAFPLERDVFFKEQDSKCTMSHNISLLVTWLKFHSFSSFQ